jgi:hypothetical protein
MNKSYFYTAADIRMRLDCTIIRYNGKPYYCRSAGEDTFIYLYALTNVGVHRMTIDIDDLSLDYSSPPLGFINYGNRALYVSRKPHRKQKQGLCTNAALIQNLHGLKEEADNILFSKEAENMIMGVYPSYHNAHTLCTNAPSVSCAFSRNFAVSSLNGPGDLSLHHKLHRIGRWKGTAFELTPTYNTPLTRRFLAKHEVPICPA